MSDLISRCLLLSKEERVQIIDILKESLKERDTINERFAILYGIINEVVGGDILSPRRDLYLVLGRRIVAYQLKQEGYPITKIGRCLGKHHASVLHMVSMMEDVFRYPGTFNMDEVYWDRFTKKLNEYDIHSRTSQGS